MSDAFGHTAFVGIGTETTYGTPVAATHYFRLLDESMKLEGGKQFVPMLSSSVKRRTVNKKTAVSGGFKIAVPYNSFGLVLYHCLGGKAVSGVGPYAHVFTDGALPVGATIGVNRDATAIGGSSFFQYGGCHFQSLKFSNGIEGFVECEASVIGKNETLAALPSATYPTDNYISWDELTVGTINSQTVAARMVELSINNELVEDNYKLGALTRNNSGRKGGSVTAKFEYNFSTLTQHTLFTGRTNAPIALTWTDTTRILNVALATAYINEETINASDPGNILQSVSLEGDLDDLTVTLTNNDVSYA